MKKFSHYVLDTKTKYFSGVLAIILMNFIAVQIPKKQGEIIDLLLSSSFDTTALVVGLISIVLLAAAIFTFNYFSRYFMLTANSLFDYSIRSDIFTHLLDLGMDYFIENSSGDIIALSSNDLGRLRHALSQGLNMSLNTVFLFIMTAGQISSIDVTLAIVIMIPLPIVISIIFFISPKIRKRHRMVQENFSELTDISQGNISEIRTIKAFGHESSEIKRFQNKNYENFNAHKRLIKLNSLFNPTVVLITGMSYVLLFYFGGQMVINKEISIGDFVSCNTYIAMIIAPISMLSTITSLLQQGKASWERLYSFLSIPKELENTCQTDHNALNIEVFKGDIEFKNISFSYGKEEVLKGINIKVRAGSTVGIVGKIGSGKSTLGNVLLGLYSLPEESDITFSGISIKDINKELLRDNISYVPQDNFLFADTIINNIAFNENIALETVVNATKISQIHETILSFPDGYETLLGEKGVNLSGGQKQRISIARAVVKDTPILVLDDCLSAVDTETEKEIINGIKSFSKNRTTIIIAHRLTSIIDCDHILVIENGEILECGNHSELLEINGQYAEMYRIQNQEEKAR